MSLVDRVVKPLPLENMPQVASAGGAHNLGPGHAVRLVLVPLHGAGDAVKVGRPPAPRVELGRGLVQRRRASRAGVDTLARVVLVVLPRTRRLRALLSEDAELFCSSKKR